MQYEVIYEDGSHSVAEYLDDAEALAATGAHHERATRGEAALLSDTTGTVKATRIVKVLKYDKPPGQMLSAQVLPIDQLESELPAILKTATDDGVVHLPTVAAMIRDLSNPFVDSGPHDSNYKAKEVEELSLTWQ